MNNWRRFGALNNKVRVFIKNNSLTTGVGLTGLAYNTSGLVIDVFADNAAAGSGGAFHYKSAATATIQDIGTSGSTCGTYSAPSASNCRFAEVDATNHPGEYELQFLDALFAIAGCRELTIRVGGPTNCTPTWIRIPIGDPEAFYCGTAASVTASALTMASGHGLPTIGSLLVVFTGANKGKSRFGSLSGDVITYDPATDEAGEAAITGTPTFELLPAAPAPTTNPGNATLSTSERNAVADALLDRADAIETGITPRGAMRVAVADAAGQITDADTAAPAIKNPAGTKTRIQDASVDTAGNRGAPTLDLT